MVSLLIITDVNISLYIVNEIKNNFNSKSKATRTIISDNADINDFIATFVFYVRHDTLQRPIRRLMSKQ